MAPEPPHRGGISTCSQGPAHVPRGRGACRPRPSAASRKNKLNTFTAKPWTVTWALPQLWR